MFINEILNKRLCPKCHEKISKTVNKCPYCGEDVNIEENNSNVLNKDTHIIVKCVIACIITMMCFSFISRQILIMRYKHMSAQIEEKRKNGELKNNHTIESAVETINTFWDTSYIIKKTRKRLNARIEDAKIDELESYYITAYPDDYIKIGEREYQCAETKYRRGNISFKFIPGDAIKFTDSATGDVAIYKMVNGKLTK